MNIGPGAMRARGQVKVKSPEKNLLDRLFLNFVNTLPITREYKKRNKKGGVRPCLRVIANQTYHRLNAT